MTHHYDRFSGCSGRFHDNSALWALAQSHFAKGVYDPSCAVTGDEIAIYRAFYKDLGGDIKAGIKAQKTTRLIAA